MEATALNVNHAHPSVDQLRGILATRDRLFSWEENCRSHWGVVQILLDPKTRVPRLEDYDEPLEQFRSLVTEAGLHVRELLVVRPDTPGSTSEGEYCVLAISFGKMILDKLPV
jgi:hypothetical protein